MYVKVCVRRSPSLTAVPNLAFSLSLSLLFWPERAVVKCTRKAPEKKQQQQQGAEHAHTLRDNNDRAPTTNLNKQRTK